jgi:hypothetical protein
MVVARAERTVRVREEVEAERQREFFIPRGKGRAEGGLDREGRRVRSRIAVSTPSTRGMMGLPPVPGMATRETKSRAERPRTKGASAMEVLASRPVEQLRKSALP